MRQIITELTDLRYLEWTRTRHSSGTAGSFLKAYEQKRGVKYYYKLSSYDGVHGITGHECVNEIIADRLLTLLEIPHLSYQLIHALISVRGREMETWLCCSRDFKQPGDSKIALDAFYDLEAGPSESPLDFCVRMGFETYISQMLLIDFLILNRDRHGANIEILKNRKTRSYRPAPLFDHGLSLLFSCRSEAEYLQTDPREDKRVQSFIGSASTRDNLSLIPGEHRRPLPPLDAAAMAFLFEDITDIMGPVWCEAIRHFLEVRWKLYEDFCDQKS